MSDWHALSQWALGLKGDSRDAAVQSAIRNLPSGITPADTLAMAETVGDPDTRTGILQYVIHRWAEKDPGAAAAWIRTSNLTNEEKESLLSASTTGTDPIQ